LKRKKKSSSRKEEIFHSFSQPYFLSLYICLKFTQSFALCFLKIKFFIEALNFNLGFNELKWTIRITQQHKTK